MRILGILKAHTNLAHPLGCGARGLRGGAREQTAFAPPKSLRRQDGRCVRSASCRAFRTFDGAVNGSHEEEARDETHKTCRSRRRHQFRYERSGEAQGPAPVRTKKA